MALKNDKNSLEIAKSPDSDYHQKNENTVSVFGYTQQFKGGSKLFKQSPMETN